MDVKERIAVGAHELFLKFGIKSITMDDIATHLSVSKKTIYQHYKDKDELVKKVTEEHVLGEQESVRLLRDKAKDAIDEIYHLTQHVRSHITTMNPAIVFDMKKYHPQAYMVFVNHKQQCIYSCVVGNLERGKREGFYREEIKNEILAKLRMEQIELAFDPSIFPPGEFNLIDVQMEAFTHFIMGILTPKGLEQWNMYKNEDSNLGR